MEPVIINLVSALAIGSIIALMASLNSNRLRALVYSLPIPVTIVLIATGGEVNTTHLIGLVLGILFLWSVAFLHGRGISILVADLLGAGAYLLAGYVAVSYIKVPFYVAVVCVSIAWSIFVYLYKNRVTKDKDQAIAKIHPLIKLPIVSVFAYILLSFKALFSGIIVTFPFSGVFAVIENRHMLERLASTFTRNSIAIIGLFITTYVLEDMNVFMKLAIAWVVYLLILRIVAKTVPFKS